MQNYIPNKSNTKNCLPDKIYSGIYDKIRKSNYIQDWFKTAYW